MEKVLVNSIFSFSYNVSFIENLHQLSFWQPGKEVFENTVEKRENAGNQHTTFSTMFLTQSKKSCSI